MGKRLIDTDIFKKGFVKSLPPNYKLLWLYIHNDCSHAGIWEVEIDVAELRLGITLDGDPTKVFASEIVVFDNGSKWFIPSFIEFQYGELNPQNRVHNSVITILKSQNLEGAFKPRLSPVEGAKDKDIYKYKDIEKEKDNTTREGTFNSVLTENEKKEDVPKRKVFEPPTLDEVVEYMTEKKGTEWSIPHILGLANKFWNHYDGKGWKVGKDKMQKWKSAASNAINDWDVKGFDQNENIQARAANKPIVPLNFPI